MVLIRIMVVIRVAEVGVLAATAKYPSVLARSARLQIFATKKKQILWELSVMLSGCYKLACQRQPPNIPQCQRGARVCKFLRQKHCILQLQIFTTKTLFFTHFCNKNVFLQFLATTNCSFLQLHENKHFHGATVISDYLGVH